MKFSAAGGWWGSDWYNRVELGYRYGFDGNPPAESVNSCSFAALFP